MAAVCATPKSSTTVSGFLSAHSCTEKLCEPALNGPAGLGNMFWLKGWDQAFGGG